MDAEANTFTFFVEIFFENGFKVSGVILSSEYILTYNFNSFPSKVAYGIQPGQSIDDPWENFNLVNPIQLYNVSSNGRLRILKVEPIPLGTVANAISFTNCSGPSKVNVGDSIAYFGLGVYEDSVNNFDYADTMKTKCAEVIEFTAKCSDAVSLLGNVICTTTDGCNRDWGAPLVIYSDGTPYLVGIMSYVKSTGCGREFTFSSTNHIPLTHFQISEPDTMPHSSVCESFDAIDAIINAS